MTRLIINADDFGLTPGINRSILELQQKGALTSATMMATTDHVAAAAAGAALQPSLGVGCHVILVDGTPALPRDRIPLLALPSGGFRPTLGVFVRDLLRGAIPEAEIETEAIAQIQRLQALGVHVTHLDAHKHTHMFPRVLRPLLRAAAACGVRAIRNPFEPDWALHATPHAPVLRRMQVRVLRRLHSEFLKLVRQSGIATTDGAIGVLATGTLDKSAVCSLLATMPPGTWELVCHPGYFNEDLNNVQTRLRESRAIEQAALLEVVPSFTKMHPDVSLIHFGQIAEKIA